MRYWKFTIFSRMLLASSRGGVCLMGDNLNHISYPNIEFFGSFGKILTIRAVETFILYLNS
jgi:hypothetical protein